MSGGAQAIRRADTGEVLLGRARLCRSFWCHFRGLMLRAPLAEGEALLFVYSRASVSATTIHMLFMRFPIAVLWLDGDRVVVDAKLAKPWRPVYAPRKAARYVIEARPEVLGRVAVGDRLVWE